MTHRVKVKLDANHHHIVLAFQGCGCTVQSLAGVGQGCPDLLVAGGGCRMFLVEVKVPGGRLTPFQHRWAERWPEPVYEVRSPEEAVELYWRRKSDSGVE